MSFDITHKGEWDAGDDFASTGSSGTGAPMAFAGMPGFEFPHPILRVCYDPVVARPVLLAAGAPYDSTHLRNARPRITIALMWKAVKEPIQEPIMTMFLFA